MAAPAPLRRILYVEDDPDIRTVANLALVTVGGYELRTCASGQEAIDAAAEFAPDLFLIDVMMPGLDGPQTLSLLRQIPAVASVPAVFMTAKIQPSEIARYKEMGVVEVIPKPFDPMRLAEDVRAAFQKA
jgi:two-component system, OmpR family, response regulator